MYKNVTLQNLPSIAQDILEKVSPKEDQATVIGLSGDLGAGKTTLVQHIAREFGITEHIVSPTFMLMCQYPLENQKFTQLVHIDAYRFEDPKELEHLDWGQLLADPQNLICIEWPEQVRTYIPEDALVVKIQLHEEDRDIDLTSTL